MDIETANKLVAPYSPWLSSALRPAWRDGIPAFKRPVFERLVEDIGVIDQIISITGPRRVGKSTLLQQVVQHLLNEKHVDPNCILYYSLDDPALFRPTIHGGELIEVLMENLAKLGKPAYLLLDEIQALERWELYLKKYYDLKYPIRLIVSGSASSPIFKKSRESLLGRVKDYHVLPFSFREFLMYRLHADNMIALLSEVQAVNASGKTVRGMLTRSPEHLNVNSAPLIQLSDGLWDVAAEALNDYLVDGGFPEVWRLPSPEKKIEYLFDNQVKKVIYEDLVLATEFRKPEQLKSFYVSLLERPGMEVNVTSLSGQIGISSQQIDKYLPLLEMTDLLAHASKFRKTSVTLRKGNRKYYLVDLALRNAVLRIGREILQDDTMLGMYAENLVFNALKRWDGVIQIDYYRENQKEVDFIVQTKPSSYLPIEVKYRNNWNRAGSGIPHFMSRFSTYQPIVVTKNKGDWGRAEISGIQVLQVPLLQFLLMFD